MGDYTDNSFVSFSGFDVEYGSRWCESRSPPLLSCRTVRLDWPPLGRRNLCRLLCQGPVRVLIFVDWYGCWRMTIRQLFPDGGKGLIVLDDSCMEDERIGVMKRGRRWRLANRGDRRCRSRVHCSVIWIRTPEMVERFGDTGLVGKWAMVNAFGARCMVKARDGWDTWQFGGRYLHGKCELGDHVGISKRIGGPTLLTFLVFWTDGGISNNIRIRYTHVLIEGVWESKADVWFKRNVLLYEVQRLGEAHGISRGRIIRFGGLLFELVGWEFWGKLRVWLNRKLNWFSRIAEEVATMLGELKFTEDEMMEMNETLNTFNERREEDCPLGVQEAGYSVHKEGNGRNRKFIS
ncbi:hypothetical protein V6N13_019824 [Hibiscus sabdariffa]